MSRGCLPSIYSLILCVQHYQIWNAPLRVFHGGFIGHSYLQGLEPTPSWMRARSFGQHPFVLAIYPDVTDVGAFLSGMEGTTHGAVGGMLKLITMTGIMKPAVQVVEGARSW